MPDNNDDIIVEPMTEEELLGEPVKEIVPTLHHVRHVVYFAFRKTIDTIEVMDARDHEEILAILQQRERDRKRKKYTLIKYSIILAFKILFHVLTIPKRALLRHIYHSRKQ